MKQSFYFRQFLTHQERFEDGWKEQPNGCWQWMGGRKGPYGRFWFHGKHIRAHRAAYLLKHGSIPERLHVLHSCDNPLCVNDAHLFLGTHQDNIQDCVAKGRNRKGASINTAKLTESSVKWLRTHHHRWTTASLARKFSVHWQTMFNAIHKKSWRHLP